MASTMRAWQYSTVETTLPAALTLNPAAPKPDSATLPANHLLIQTLSAALNPVDYKLPESPVVGRLMACKRPATPGVDYCGRVIAAHPSVAVDFPGGALVFGAFTTQPQHGVLGEFLVVSAAETALLPAGLGATDGAAVGIAATTALQSLLPTAGDDAVSEVVKAGARVFIHGGSGGVGSWAVQLAKAMGAEVTCTCSTANVELCRRLGADEVLDYKSVDYVAELSAKGKVFDAVIDNVGADELFGASAAFLKPSAPFVQVGVGPGVTLGGIGTSMYRMATGGVFGRPYTMVMQKCTRRMFETIGRFMEEGKAKPVIDQVFEFEDVPAAYEKLRGGRAKGKIVVHISD